MNKQPRIGIPRHLSEGKKEWATQAPFGLGNKRIDKLPRMWIPRLLSEGEINIWITIKKVDT
jgi:hypothetical protein